MSAEHSHHIENPNATTPPPKIDVIGSVPAHGRYPRAPRR